MMISFRDRSSFVSGAVLATFAVLAPGCQSSGGRADGSTRSESTSGGVVAGSGVGGTTGGGGSDTSVTTISAGGGGATGGIVATGGVSSTGGVFSSGGTAGMNSTGDTGSGLAGSGGVRLTGGAGGSSATGGTTGNGGITGGTGGTPSPGGSKVTGGTTGSGGVLGTAGTGSGGSLGGSGGSLGWAVRMANSTLARHPNPDTIASSNFSWEVGYAMWTFEKVWRATKDPKYYTYIKKYVDQHVSANGNLSGFSASRLDDFLPGYAILLLYEQTQAQQYLTAATTLRNAFKTYPRNSDNGFWHSTGNPNQMWVDGVFMGQMFLARYGHATGESAAFDEVITQMTDIVNHCMKTNGLLLHAYDESKKASWANSTTGLSPEVWSEGLGWYAVLIADLFDYLPADHPGRPGLMTILGQLTAGLKANQDAKSGRWCQVVDKCTLSDNWNESSGTGMFLYLTKKSIDKGYIDGTQYSAVVSSAYQGLVQKATVNTDGTIDINDCSSIGVQGSYSAYVSKAKQVSPPSCVSSFIAGTLMVEGPSFATP
jgi:rhamnogalacturonyl hydrolase YesR